MLRRLAKGAAWLLGSCVVLLAAWFGINATDEPLSAEARAALDVPPLPAPARDNGFLDLLVLAAPADTPTFEAGIERLHAFNNQTDGRAAPPPWGDFRLDPRVSRCAAGAVAGETWENLPSCAEAALDARLPEALRAHETLLRRYRAMREKPKVVNLIATRSPDDELPAYSPLLDAQLLILLGAARRFQAGDRAGALRELELDADFYRRMSSQTTKLIDKMLAFAAQDRIAMVAVELARRTPERDAAIWRRLERLVRPPTKEELDLAPVLRREMAQIIGWMRTRQYARPSDASYDAMERFMPGATGMHRRWGALTPYFYRPHQSVNHVAARCLPELAVAESSSTEFKKAAAAARGREDALEPGLIKRVIINPAGWNHPYLPIGCYLDYVARGHARGGVQTLARLTIKLRAAGISTPNGVATALSGPLGREHADPFTGEPMRFDPKSRTIGFEAERRHISGVARGLRDRYGRMALPL
jgi:hypothetical protein